ncbi:hypothetical protein Tco_0545977 [Tanacetum coccineum]
MEEYYQGLRKTKLVGWYGVKTGKLLCMETATYGKIWYDEDVHDLISVETEFPAIVFDDAFTSEVTHSYELMISPLNDNKIDFRISFDESDDEDYTPTVSCLNDLDFFKDFENEFPAIVYNDALTSKSYFLTEPAVSPQHIDDLKDETSLFECDKEEQNVLYFNDVFPFNVIYPDDSKLDKDNDDDKIDIKQSLGVNVINTDVAAYAHGTVDTAYSLNEYSVFDTGINTAYPREPFERKDLVDYIFSGILCVLFVLGFRHAFAHTFLLINATWGIYRAKYQESFSF